MNIVFRVDSSSLIGVGHVARCLTLAKLLQNRDVKIAFICRELEGNIISEIEENGFPVFKLLHFSTLKRNSMVAEQSLNMSWESDAKDTLKILASIQQPIDWLVVDNYFIDINWEKQVKPHVNRIMVIDDLANRTHDCDLLLDQNYYYNYESRYERLVPSSCKKLLGPQNLLLKPEFLSARDKIKIRKTIKKILVSFGGSDPTKETEKTIEAIVMLDEHDLAFDIVIGPANSRRTIIEKRCKKLLNANCHYRVLNMAKMIVDADLAIGACGISLWERCFLGLPSIIVAIADNQLEAAQFVADKGAALLLGQENKANSLDLAEAIARLVKSPDALSMMSKNAFKLTADLDLSEKSMVIDCMLDN